MTQLRPEQIDVGTGANQIVQLDGYGNMPAVGVGAMTGSAAGLDSDATAHAASNGGSHSLVASAVQPSTAPVLTGTNITGIPAAGVTGTAVVQADVGTAAALDVGTGAGDVAAGNKGVTNGDSHDHDGGDGATIPVAGGGTGATTAAAALTALGGIATPAAAELVSGLPLWYYQGRFVTRWKETFNQSRNAAALAAAGYTLSTPGASTITEDGSYLSIVVPAALSSEWYNGTYNSPYIQRTVPLRDAIFWCSYEIPATTHFGMYLQLRITDTDANFVQVAPYYDGAAFKAFLRKGPATVIAADAASRNTGYLALRVRQGAASVGVDIYDSASAPATVPGVDDWTTLTTTTHTWAHRKITMMIGTYNFGAMTGGTVKIFDCGIDPL